MAALDYPAFIAQLKNCETETENGRVLAKVLLGVAAEELESLINRNKVQVDEIVRLQKNLKHASSGLRKSRLKAGAGSGERTGDG
jgi:hypothetical protein